MNVKSLMIISCMAVMTNSNVYAGRTRIDVSEAVRTAVAVDRQLPQQQGKQSQGRVIDEQGNPIIGATVTQKGRITAPLPMSTATLHCRHLPGQRW